MERCSNKACSFLLFLVRDIGLKRFYIAVLEGKGFLGGWRLLSEKLHRLGVVPRDGFSRGGLVRKEVKEDHPKH